MHKHLGPRGQVLGKPQKNPSACDFHVYIALSATYVPSVRPFWYNERLRGEFRYLANTVTGDKVLDGSYVYSEGFHPATKELLE